MSATSYLSKIRAVYNAFGDSRSRTLGGIARDTKISKLEVRQILDSYPTCFKKDKIQPMWSEVYSKIDEGLDILISMAILEDEILRSHGLKGK